MPDQILSNSKIIGSYIEKTPGSEKLASEAQGVLPSGIAHDSRYLKPYALYIDKAFGPHKWDVDDEQTQILEHMFRNARLLSLLWCAIGAAFRASKRGRIKTCFSVNMFLAIGF